MLCLGCAILTYSAAHLYRLAATALHIVDRPNHRSAHGQSTPTGAGVSFVLIFCLALWWVSEAAGGGIRVAVLPPLLIVALLGFVDDLRPLPWPLRALVQTLCAAWVVAIVGFPAIELPGGEYDFGKAGLVFGVLALVWLLNLYNFMDGMDGMAIGEAALVLLFALAMAACIGGRIPGPAVPVLLACCLGFAIINWPEAKVFMGDGGSNFLGLAFGVLILSETLLPLWSWLILLGWFVTDACLTITLRAIRGEKIHKAHDRHAYQHLNRAIGTRGTLAVIAAVNTLWLLPFAFAATVFRGWGPVLLLLAFLPLLVFQFYCGAGRATPKLANSRRD